MKCHVFLVVLYLAIVSIILTEGHKLFSVNVLHV